MLAIFWKQVGLFIQSNPSNRFLKKTVTLAMSMDSTSVLIRDEGWKHATAATLSTYDAEGNRLDTVYIGRMPEKGKIQAKRHLEKEVEAITTDIVNQH